MNELFGKLLGLPVVASEHGAAVDLLIIYVHYLMAALFAGWICYFFYVLWRFNFKANPKADYVGIRSHASSWIEAAVAAVEGVLLLGFAIPMWASSAGTNAFPKPADHPTAINIIAQQFAWNVFYPGADGVFARRDPALVSTENPWGFDPSDPNGKDDFAPLLNEIHVPVNRPVVITLSSKDVIHSFKIIAMRVTQDAIPGLRIPIHFVPTKVGVYQINCAQLCGEGHAGMTGGRLYVDTQADYDKWFAAKAKAAADAAATPPKN